MCPPAIGCPQERRQVSHPCALLLGAADDIFGLGKFCHLSHVGRRALFGAPIAIAGFVIRESLRPLPPSPMARRSEGTFRTK